MVSYLVLLETLSCFHVVPSDVFLKLTEPVELMFVALPLLSTSGISTEKLDATLPFNVTKHLDSVVPAGQVNPAN
jgi:hypothetical protein